MSQRDKPGILIVDDSLTILHTLKKIFSSAHHPVHITPSVVEAIEVLRQEKEKIEIIFLDILMPDKDGFSLLNYLNKQHTHPVKVIALTAVKDEEVKRKFFSFSSAKVTTLEYLTKPVSRGDLLQVVKHACLPPESRQEHEANEILHATLSNDDLQAMLDKLSALELHTASREKQEILEQKVDLLLKQRPSLLAKVGFDLIRVLIIGLLVIAFLELGGVEALNAFVAQRNSSTGM